MIFIILFVGDLRSRRGARPDVDEYYKKYSSKEDNTLFPITVVANSFCFSKERKQCFENI